MSHFIRGIEASMGGSLTLYLVVKVLAFYGVHPVAPLDLWCYATAMFAASALAHAVAPEDPEDKP